MFGDVVDDVPAARLDHCGHTGPGAVVAAHRASAHGGLEGGGLGLIGAVQERGVIPDRGVVDQHVDAPEGLQARVDGAAHLQPIRQIAGNGQALPARGAHRFSGSPVLEAVNVQGDDVSPLFRQPHRNPAADADCGAGDDGDLAS